MQVFDEVGSRTEVANVCAAPLSCCCCHAKFMIRFVNSSERMEGAGSGERGAVGRGDDDKYGMVPYHTISVSGLHI